MGLPLNFLRMRNLLGQGQDPNFPQGFGPTPPPEPLFEIPQMRMQQITENAAPMQVLTQQQQPEFDIPYENAANQRLLQLLSNMPQREEPSLGRKLTSIATGIAHGPEAQEKFLYAPSNRKMQDWQAQVTPTANAASIERQMNTSLANIRTQDRRADVADKRAQTYQDRVMSQNETDRERNETARKAQELKSFIANRPDVKWELDENNEYVGLDTKGGSPIKSGIKSNQLSDVQKIELGLDAAKQRIQAAGDVDAAIEGLRQEGRVALEDRQAANKAEGEANKTQPPSQQKVDYYNKAQQAFNTDPEARKFITLGVPGTNDFSLKPPARFTAFGMNKDAAAQDQKTYERIAQSIYGPNWKSITGSNTETTPPPTTGQVRRQRNPRTGQIRESTDDGKTWKIIGQ